jgi:hypothetical protein
LKLNIFDVFFGCWHRRLSFPFSVRQGQHAPAAAQLTGTYVVCLKCGKEFPYDWDTLSLVPEKQPEMGLRQRILKFMH